MPEALAAAARLPVVWLGFLECTGDTESFLRASNPTVTSILLDLISLNYHETLMAPAGHMARKSLEDTDRPISRASTSPWSRARSPPQPMASTAPSAAARPRASCSEVCGSALATIAVGACAWDGGWPGAAPNPSAAVGREGRRARHPQPDQHARLPDERRQPDGGLRAIPDSRHVAADRQRRAGHNSPTTKRSTTNARATTTTKRAGSCWPGATKDTARAGACTRWAAEGQKPSTTAPRCKWNDRTSWPIGAGHGCIGCASRDFWDHDDAVLPAASAAAATDSTSSKTATDGPIRHEH